MQGRECWGFFPLSIPPHPSKPLCCRGCFIERKRFLCYDRNGEMDVFHHAASDAGGGHGVRGRLGISRRGSVGRTDRDEGYADVEVYEAAMSI